MRSVCLFLSILSIFLFSCEEEEISSEALTGTFAGIYLPLIMDNVRIAPTEVSLSLHNGSFIQEYNDQNGQRTTCEGSYKLSGDKITFKSTCGDSVKVVLAGKYHIKLKGSTLELYRKNGKALDDHYTLEKL
jgi:hypothetical protein